MPTCGPSLITPKGQRRDPDAIVTIGEAQTERRGRTRLDDHEVIRVGTRFGHFVPKGGEEEVEEQNVFN